MDLEKLEKLNDLKDKGVITEAEFQQQKEKKAFGVRDRMIPYLDFTL